MIILVFEFFLNNLKRKLTEERSRLLMRWGIEPGTNGKIV